MLFNTLGLTVGLACLAYLVVAKPTCTIPAAGDGSDDAPAIRFAFEECGNGGHIIFKPNTTYHVNTVMNTTGLSDVQVDLHGYLLWSDDLDYWLNNSMPIGYQNQSTVWFLGGDNLRVNGHSTGTLDGNGQAWYDLVQGESNYPRRPMAITIVNTTNSVFEGLRFVQSQMWTMTVQYSKDVLLQDIYVNNTSSNDNSAHNTDGCDTLYSDGITFRRWNVDNGDDAIALKGNSTNILVEDCTFRRGQGFALGSIGQYADRYEIIANATIRNITAIGTKYAAYIKTWTGEQVNYPPNGGGGGTGYIRNITITDYTLTSGRSSPFSISQCTSYSGGGGDCDTSTFKIEDVSFNNIAGSADTDVVANMQCSAAAAGCENVRIEGIEVHDLSSNSTDAVVDEYLCSNVEEPVGFVCTGDVVDNPGGS